MHFGSIVKQWADQKGVGPTELAKRINKTKQAVFDIFEKQHIHTRLLEEICRALGITLEIFFYQNGMPVESSDSINKDNQHLKEQNNLLKKLNEWLEKDNKRMAALLEQPDGDPAEEDKTSQKKGERKTG